MKSMPIRRIVWAWAAFSTVPAAAWSQLAESPWPKFGADLRNTHSSEFAGPSSEARIAWTYQSPGSANYQPVIGPTGVVYFTTNASRGLADYSVNAVAPDGKLLWELRPDAAGCWPCVSADGKVLFTRWRRSSSAGGYLSAVDASGQQAWLAPLTISQAVQVGPTIGPDGTVYVGDQDGHLYAFTGDGELIWKSTGGAYLCTPAIDGDGNLYTGGWGVVRAVGPDGSPLWTFNTQPGTVTSVSIGADGTIYAGTHIADGYLYALTPSGQPIWHIQGVGMMTSIGPDGTIYASSSSEICSVTPQGSVSWRYEIGERSDASVTAEGFAVDRLGYVYASTPMGEVICLDPDGQLQWSLDVAPEWLDESYPGAPIIGGEGLLYVANGYPGALVAIVPEPAALALLMPGGLALMRGRKRR